MAHVLVLVLLMPQLFAIYRGIRRQGTLGRLAERPRLRSRLYLLLIAGKCGAAAAVPIIVLVSPQLSMADIGWAWPNGDGIDYLLTGYVLALTVIGGLRVRYRMRRGRVSKLRIAMAAILPETPRERWLAAALAFSAGIGEEVVFRGFLIGAGIRLYHLPAVLAAAVALVLFALGHAYQGRRGMIRIGVLGAIYTLVYAISGSVLPTIVLHVCQDLMALLVIPARPTVPAPPPVPTPVSAVPAEPTGFTLRRSVGGQPGS